MIMKRFLLTILTLCFACGLTACQRNQEQLTPAAKTEEGRKSAQEYPSTRNTENPDPSIGGSNSASNRPEAHPEPTGQAPEQTKGH
jgi:hypothetical protein